MAEFSELQANILEWAKERGILESSTPEAQFTKTREEVEELEQGLENNDLEEIRDAIGDVIVTLILLAELAGMDVVDCLDGAYNEIKNRKGKMVDGVFVKEE